MQKLLPILATGILIISACNSNSAPTLPTILPGTEQPINGLAAQGSCENELLPVVQGASWVYSSIGGPNGDFTYKDTISETHAGGFTLTSDFPNQSVNQTWVCTPDGLIAYQLGGGTTASVSMQNMISGFTTIEVNGLSLPALVTPGQTWNYNLTMEGSIETPGGAVQSPGTFKLDMQELGKESITVPAGTFEATRIQATFNAQISVDFQGSPVPYMVNGTSIVWYAPGVGYIKSIENIDFSGTTFTSTTELQTYSIP